MIEPLNMKDDFEYIDPDDYKYYRDEDEKDEDEQIAVMMRVEEIRTDKPFTELFEIDDENLNAIMRHMSISGYDRSQPLVLWKETGTLIDGHTRYRAVQELGEFNSVPVVEKSFASEEEAVEYVIHNHTERRNLTDKDILKLVETVDKLYIDKWGGSRRPSTGDGTEPSFGNQKLDSRERTANIVGISKDKVSQCRHIIKNCPETEVNAIYWGEKTIYQVYSASTSLRRKMNEEKKRVERETIMSKLSMKPSPYYCYRMFFPPDCEIAYGSDDRINFPPEIEARFKPSSFPPNKQKGITFCIDNDVYFVTKWELKKSTEKCLHLEKLCLNLLTPLWKKDSIMEQIKKEVMYFKNKGKDTLKELAEQKYIQEFLASPFVDDFITILEAFGHEIKRPENIVPTKRPEKKRKEETIYGIPVSEYFKGYKEGPHF